MDSEIEYALQALYIAKIFYDHDRLTQLLENLHKHISISWDELSEIERAAVQSIFADSRCYWQCNCKEWRSVYAPDRETYVLRDPLLTRYDGLCRMYEAENGITKVENPFARNLDHVIQNNLWFGDYSYDYFWADSTQDRRGAKIVLFLFEEFSSYYYIPDGLFSILDFCAENIPALEASLAEKAKEKLIQLPLRAIPEQEAA